MIPQSIPIFVATKPIDMRRSIKGLTQATEEVLRKNPQDRALFVFYNRACSRIKILWWDKTGFCILYKALHTRYRFSIPENQAPGAHSIEIAPQELAHLLRGVHRRMTRKARQEISRKVRHSVLRIVSEPASPPPA